MGLTFQCTLKAMEHHILLKLVDQLTAHTHLLPSNSKLNTLKFFFPNVFSHTNI